MRLILLVLGILLILAGTVWVLQGAGVILGSFMSNDPTWIGIGSVTVVVGLVGAVLGVRSGASAKNA